MKKPAYNLIAITGPTASGKTFFAAQFACRINGEIISADSRQVYKYMNLGTGKDYDDYTAGSVKIPVHLIDIAEPGYKYNIFEYKRDFARVFKDITNRGKFPVLCGGSGMYLSAVTGQYRLDEVPVNVPLRNDLSNKSKEELTAILGSLKKLHNTTDTDTVEHAIRAIEIETWHRDNPEISKMLPDLHTLIIGIIFDRQTERQRITARLEYRLQHGMVEEVKNLLEMGIPAETLMYYGLEYRYLTLYLQGNLDFLTMKTQLNIAIHQFAKRQRTWFRKMEKEGYQIHWIDGGKSLNEKLEAALKLAGF